VGEHTRNVLGDLLGYSAERIDALLKENVIGAVSEERATSPEKR
jgi:hypothetical protein